jgi:hypothetical protein
MKSKKETSPLPYNMLKRTLMPAIALAVLVLIFVFPQVNSVTGGPSRYFRDAIEIAKWLDGAALKTPAEHRVRPELLIAQTGLMQGAAGVGLVLLRFAAEEGPARPGTARIVMPDSAF